MRVARIRVVGFRVFPLLPAGDRGLAVDERAVFHHVPDGREADPLRDVFDPAVSDRQSGGAVVEHVRTIPLAARIVNVVDVIPVHHVPDEREVAAAVERAHLAGVQAHAVHFVFEELVLASPEKDGRVRAFVDQIVRNRDAAAAHADGRIVRHLAA